MSKKFRIILACLLTLVLLPSLSLAAGEVAEVGGVKYATFGEAVNAAIAGSDKTITVIGEVGNYSFSGKNMTGITVQGSETGKITGTLNVTGSTTTFKDATFKNLTFEGGNIVFSTATKNFENFTIDNCVFNGPSNTESKPAIQFQKAAGVSVDGVKITNNKINNYTGAGILLNGGGGSGCTVTISGNTISNVNSNAIQALNIENLIISDNTTSNTGSVFNLYGTKNVTFKGNDVTLKSDTQYLAIYLPGLVEFDSSNTVKYNGSALEPTSSNFYPSDDGWDAIRMVAVYAEKDSSGKYTSGHFAGLESTISAQLADGLEYTGADYDWDISISDPTPTPVVSTITPTPAPVVSAITPTEEPSAPVTGDNNNIELLYILMAISLLSILIFAKKCTVH